MANSMLPHARDCMLPGWIYAQDNDPKHNSQFMLGPLRRLPDGRKARLPGWFRLNGVGLLKWPAMSPDLNPIENLWQILKRKLKGNRFQSMDKLWGAVQVAWNDIHIDTLITLVDSLPKRINAVIRARGGPTKY